MTGLSGSAFWGKDVEITRSELLGRMAEVLDRPRDGAGEQHRDRDCHRNRYGCSEEKSTKLLIDTCVEDGFRIGDAHGPENVGARQDGDRDIDEFDSTDVQEFREELGGDGS